MKASLQKQIESCKRRGGDCPCVNAQYCCAVVRRLNRDEAKAKEKLQEIKLEEYAVKQELKVIENARDLLGVPVAALREDFKFRDTGTPTLVFDGDEVQFGYEDEDGEFELEEGEWPFTAERIWWPDCEKLGFNIVT